MKDLLGRFIEIERSVAQEKGGFSLYALFLREDEHDQWDMVIAAPWIEKDKKSALHYVANKVQQMFTPNEMLHISRIVIIETDNPALPAINQAIHIEHGSMEVKNSDFFGLQIKHAYIITSQAMVAKKLKPAA